MEYCNESGGFVDVNEYVDDDVDEHLEFDDEEEIILQIRPKLNCGFPLWLSDTTGAEFGLSQAEYASSEVFVVSVGDFDWYWESILEHDEWWCLLGENCKIKRYKNN